jgi:peroxiredoxin
MIVAIAALTVSVAQAGKYNKVLSIGDQAPAFKDLTGADGKKYSLDDFKDAKAVVVCFTCNQCPVAVACEDRIIALQKEYEKRGVKFIAVSVSDSEVDNLENMKRRVETKGFNFPYTLDLTQKSARDYGARITPEFFVLDGKRKIAYMGVMDDSQVNPNDVTKSYLNDALEAVLSGSSVAVAETKTRGSGCGIRYSR